jgi:hypothetical protein
MIATVSGTYLVNSEDWKDVYSGSYHAYSQGETPYFVRGNNLGVFNVMPYGEPVNIIESSSRPMVTNIEQQVRAQDYQVDNTTVVESANLELRPEDNENVIVVPEDYPPASLVAAPYARATDSWVLIVNEQNLGDVQEIVEESEESVMIGDFNREISNAMNGTIDRTISSPSRFNLSVKVAKAYMEEKSTDRFLVASGDYINKDIMEGEDPVLLSGTNYLTEDIREFMFENPGHNVTRAIMIGNEMTDVGQEIRDHNITRNGETTREKVSVFIQYGQARGNSDIYAISLFPLPTGDLSLNIPATRYNPETGELLITYSNGGKNRMYQLTSFEIISDGEVVETGGDNEAVFIGGNTNRTVSYQTNISVSQARNASIEFSTTYGTSPSQLDTYLTEEEEFSPPLRKNIAVEEIRDDSNITIESLSYLKNAERFKVVLRNNRGESAYGQVRLIDVMVGGEETSFETARKEVPPKGTETFYITAELDSIDIEQNSDVQTTVSYGESRNALVKTASSTKEPDYTSRLIPTDTGTIIGGTAILLIVLALLAYRRSDIKLEVSTE